MVHLNFALKVPLTFVLSYIIHWSYNKQNAWRAPVAGMCIGNLWDLGSNPRSPFLFHTIFLIMILCSSSFSVHHATHNPGMPRISWSQSKGGDLKNILGMSQRTYTLAKKSIRPRLNGPELLGLYLQLGTEPPKVLYFFSFLYFICFNYFFFN